MLWTNWHTISANNKVALTGQSGLFTVEYLKMADPHTTQAYIQLVLLSTSKFTHVIRNMAMLQLLREKQKWLGQKKEHFQQIFQLFEGKRSTFLVFLSSSCRFLLLCCSSSLKFLRMPHVYIADQTCILAFNVSTRSEIGLQLHENGTKWGRGESFSYSSLQKGEVRPVWVHRQTHLVQPPEKKCMLAGAGLSSPRSHVEIHPLEPNQCMKLVRMLLTFCHFLPIDTAKLSQFSLVFESFLCSDIAVRPFLLLAA